MAPKNTTVRVTRTEPASTVGAWRRDLVAGELIEVPSDVAAHLIEHGMAAETDEKVGDLPEGQVVLTDTAEPVYLQADVDEADGTKRYVDGTVRGPGEMPNVTEADPLQEDRDQGNIPPDATEADLKKGNA